MSPTLEPSSSSMRYREALGRAGGIEPPPPPAPAQPTQPRRVRVRVEGAKAPPPPPLVLSDVEVELIRDLRDLLGEDL